ncbi:MAG: hypothetical protein H7A33_03510 [Deltaproteobacteria bacterium]|nr:hypothetical protein [Deltaproteobacteria bacterium]
MLKLISFLICLILIVGIAISRHRKWHIRLMLSAFALDMLLVLYIEFTRKAINTSLHPPHGFIIFHVIISVLVVALYIAQIISGSKINKGKGCLSWHGRIAILFLILRLGNFATSLFVEKFKPAAETHSAIEQPITPQTSLFLRS